MPINAEFNRVYEEAIHRAITDASIGMKAKRVDAGEKTGFQPFVIDKQASAGQLLAIQRLLDLDILRCEIPEHLHFHYAWTDFGRAVFHHPNFPGNANQ